ncbi:ribosome small subunit-dependent GTPase A [Fulvivirga lutimaris]|uniref:ribosome small subunit-dependent GTPase A n=1 Tax=Fulvivirga lutimaris TaxID=1819566 RepID=UPI0012BC479E|nr:ribosome small subunit-dependent GTPase A [Fulvivirga lutimaris]MTI40561.1 ribosome small subunit-dependent GTPase A [Fulvivirga lutimaris]
MRGLVIRSTGSWYDVLAEDNKTYACRTRGKLRLSGFKTTNPIAVGDNVEFDLEANETEGLIYAIQNRDNYIIRKSIKNKNQGHIIAANIDQTILVATLTLPRTSLGFIDRFLVSAEAFRIPQVLIFNKSDLLSSKELEKQNEYIKLYQNIGVDCLVASATEKIGIEEIKEKLSGKKSLFSGHSGVGKSTLINCIAPKLNLKTSDVSSFSDKGVHTTTFAEMFNLGENTFIIDTPGIKELGLIDMEQDEISDYFPEMRDLIGECKFHNCKHTHEPGCAIKIAVEEGQIAGSRYKSYLSMLENDDNRR